MVNLIAITKKITQKNIRKPRVEAGIRGGRWGWLGLGGDVGGKCRQLYLNYNKKKVFLEEEEKVETKNIRKNYQIELVCYSRKYLCNKKENSMT